jgi:uncharacterized protein YbjT (DUF2867 family)
MNILLTGATGYIGKRLLPILLNEGHHVICLVRDKNRFTVSERNESKIDIVEGDLLKPNTLKKVPKNIDAAYYLVHSMSTSANYAKLEENAAVNFNNAISKTTCRQVIYLSGIVNEKSLSKHLNSRKRVEEILSLGTYNLTTLRAGIIIGSGSASFEIIRDLVEKLPIMITPKWLKTKCQPIAVSDVIKYLIGVLNCPETYNKNYDIGGTDILSYKDMLLGYAKARGMLRKIIVIGVMTPKISSYWLYFITSTSYKLATALVESMKVEVICTPNNLSSILNINPIGYQESLERTLSAIQDNHIISSWKDALSSGRIDERLSDYLKVPEYGCYTDQKILLMNDKSKSLNKLWSIGGETGWYAANFLWKLRGFIDQLFGGVGLRRGRSHPSQIHNGDAVDFWRVLYANKDEGRLLLFAEMKLPGEAWLEFKVNDNKLQQTATFRPKGLLGRLYWYAVLPFHSLIFRKMLKEICK